MTILKDLKQGDVVFLKSCYADVPDAVRAVSKVDRKFIYVGTGENEITFDKESGRSKAAYCYTLYPSRGDYEQEQAVINRKKYLLLQIEEVIKYLKLESLEDLEKIATILGIES